MKPVLKLYGYGSAFGLPDASYFVMKTEAQFRLAGISYEKVASSPRASPKKTLPFVELNGEVTADSAFIRWHVERLYKVDFDRRLNDYQRAIAWSVERMLEDHLRWTMIPTRIFDRENFRAGYATFFANLPGSQRAVAEENFVTKSRQRFEAMGMGMHNDDEIFKLGTTSLNAFSVLLETRPFLCGDLPTSVDATALGILSGLLTPHFPSRLRDHALSLDNLCDYVTRLMTLVFPECKWVNGKQPVEAVQSA